MPTYQTYSPDQWMSMSAQDRQVAKTNMSQDQAQAILNQLSQDQRQQLYDSNMAAGITSSTFAPTMYDSTGSAWTGKVYQDDIGGIKGIYGQGQAPAGSTRGYTELYSSPTGYQDAQKQKLLSLADMNATGIVPGGYTPEVIQQQAKQTLQTLMPQAQTQQQPYQQTYQQPYQQSYQQPYNFNYQQFNPYQQYGLNTNSGYSNNGYSNYGYQNSNSYNSLGGMPSYTLGGRANYGLLNQQNPYTQPNASIGRPRTGLL